MIPTFCFEACSHRDSIGLYWVVYHPGERVLYFFNKFLVFLTMWFTSQIWTVAYSGCVQLSVDVAYIPGAVDWAVSEETTAPRGWAIIDALSPETVYEMRVVVRSPDGRVDSASLVQRVRIGLKRGTHAVRELTHSTIWLFKDALVVQVAQSVRCVRACVCVFPCVRFVAASWLVRRRRKFAVPPPGYCSYVVERSSPQSSIVDQLISASTENILVWCAHRE